MNECGYFHMTHVVGDLDGAEQWYKKSLGAAPYLRDYDVVALRDAVFHTITGVMWEMISPTGVPNSENGAAGRFHQRFGDGLHSIALYVDDINHCYEVLRTTGLIVVGMYGDPIRSVDEIDPDATALFTHPKETYTILEFVQRGALEPYTPPPGHRDRSCESALGLLGIDYVTLQVPDAATAAQVYQDRLGASRLGVVDSADSCREYVSLGGQSVFELSSAPVGDDATAGGGPRIGASGITFRVTDVDAAEQWLVTSGVPCARVGERVEIDRRDAFGIAFGFVDAALPGDVRTSLLGVS